MGRPGGTISDLAGWLSGGDVRSDGLSDQAARFVLEHPVHYLDLIDALNNEDGVVRGRAADALEKVARSRPSLLVQDLEHLFERGKDDPVVSVRMHLAMAYGHIAAIETLRPRLSLELRRMLEMEHRPFVLSWAIASLAILGSLEGAYHDQAVTAISRLRQNPSIAVRTRVEKALVVLTGGSRSFPPGWVKGSEVKRLLGLEEGPN